MGACRRMGLPRGRSLLGCLGGRMLCSALSFVPCSEEVPPVSRSPASPRGGQLSLSVLSSDLRL